MVSGPESPLRGNELRASTPPTRCETKSPRPKLIRLAHYCCILTGGQLPSTLVGESLVVEEPKRKPDLWWIGSVVLLAVSVLGLVYPLWTNSNSH